VVDVVGTSSEFTVDTFGKPHDAGAGSRATACYASAIRFAWRWPCRKGEQFEEVSDFNRSG